MGVKGLGAIIEKYAQSSIKKKEFKHYYGTIQTIDAPVNIYKFCIAIIDTNHFKSQDGYIIGHLFACMCKSLSMLKYGIMPLWVFDGAPPSIKELTLTGRRKIRENAAMKLNETDSKDQKEISKLEKKKFSITGTHIKEIKHLLSLMGLSFIESPGEAEAQCCAFEIANICDGTVTEDWDVVLFGGKKMLKGFSNKSEVTEINIGELMKKLGMTREQLIVFSSILGNDYCAGIGGLKSVDAYLKFKVCNFNIDTFIKMLHKENRQIGKIKYKIPKNFIEKMNTSKEYYLHAPVINPCDVTIKWNEPRYEELYDYLVNIKGFSSNTIQPKILELKTLYNKYIQYGKLITLSRIKRENCNEACDLEMRGDNSNNLNCSIREVTIEQTLVVE